MKILRVFFIICFLISSSTAFSQERWIQYTSGNYINCLAAERDYIWAGTFGGVVKWNRKTGEYIKYTTLSGLADNYVKCITIDLEGNKWIGTVNGVSKFDGEQWTSYTTNNGLLSNNIYSIAVDKYGGYGRVVCGTPKGLSVFDGITWISTPLDSTPLKFGITSVAIDKNGKLWVGNYVGLWKVYRGWSSINTPSGSKSIINAITPDLTGNVWIGTRDGVGIANDYGVTWYDNSNGFPGRYVQSIAAAPDSALWFAAIGSVVKFFKNEWTKYTVGQDLPYVSMNSVSVDSAGVLWCGTSEGLYRFDGKNWTAQLTYDKIPVSIVVTDILIDFHDNIWFNSYGTLFKFDANRWTRYGFFAGGIDFDTEGKLCVLSGDTLRKFDNGEWNAHYLGARLRDYYFRIFKIDNKGNIWTGGEGGVSRLDGNTWTDYGTSNGLPGLYVQTINQDKQGNIWVGTENGAAKFDGKQWTTYDSTNGLAGKSVNVIYPDRKGNIWIGTTSGVSMFDGTKWKQFTKYNSPIDYNVKAITSDAQGTMWFGTEWTTGVYKYDGMRWTTYTAKEGLSSAYVEKIAIDSKGNVWIGTIGGVSVILKDSKINISADTVSISSLLKQNYPNPFNLTTIIPYRLENSDQVTLSIYNVLGQRIRTLVDAFLPSGVYTVQWNGRNSQNILVPSGVYFYRLNAKGFNHSKSMLLLK